MKKIMGFLLVFLMSSVLLACGGLSNDNNDDLDFDEDQVVEMGPDEIAVLLQNIDYSDVDQETMEYRVNGYMHVISTYHYDWDPENAYYTQDDVFFDVDLVFYLLAADLVENAEINLEGLIEMRTEYLNTDPEWGYTESTELNGSLNAYMYDGYFYLNPDGTLNEDGTTETLDFKQRMQDAVTQVDYDELIDEILWEAGLTDFSEIEEMLENEDLDDLIAEMPIITMYQNGNVTTIEFNITKDAIREHGVNMMLALVDFMGEEGPSQAEIDEAQTELEEGLDEYIEHLDITLRLSIEGNKVHSMAYNIRLDFDDGDTSIDIDMEISTTFGIEMPDRPTDLDDYEIVQEFDVE